MGNSIMNAIIGFMVQKMMGQGIGSMLSGGGGSGSAGIQSMLSGLTGGGGGLNRDHELVRHVQQNAGIQDPETARQYTQQGVNILDEQSRTNPQGLQSLFGSFLGEGGGQQKKGGSGGGVGEMLGDVLGG
ncbi:MAG TPA: hypothetical protein VFY41_04205 [Nitrososphaeraceae archaeon]|nr:hypothetical protein [Nitrososphaeraceae archaeon]